MADTKISSLTALTTVADGDLIPIIDVSDTTMAPTGTTKRTTAEIVAGYVGTLTLPVFNVKSAAYGAVGDGTTDDTTSIQTAINAAELVRGVVLFPTGQYLISAALVVDTQGVTLLGQGTQGTLGSATIGSAIVQSSTTLDALQIKADGITVEGLQINGPGSGTGRGIVIDDGAGAPPTQSRVTLRRVWARSFGGNGIVALKPELLLMETVWSTGNGGIGILIDSVGGSLPSWPTLINCRAQSNLGTHQIHIKDAHCPVLINCQALTGTAGNANLRLQNIASVSVVGGDFEGGGQYGIQVSGEGGSIRDAVPVSVTTGIFATSWNDGVIEGCRFPSSVTNSIQTSSARVQIGYCKDASTSGMTLNANSEVALAPRRQTVAYAASITPNPSLGDYIEVAALTGNITINDTSTTKEAKGMRMTFRFLQDGTGGRTVTWNAAYKQAWSDTGNTLNKQSTITFQFDGTNWVQIGAQSPYI